MISPELLKIGRTFLLVRIACACSASCILADFTNADAQVTPLPTATTAPQIPESLKGKSNDELVHLLIGGKSARKLEAEERRANEVETHLPDHFWEMPPKDAALALVQANCNLKVKARSKISVKSDRSPPPKGDIQLRWRSSTCSFPHEGLFSLRLNGGTSTFTFSNVDLSGPVKRLQVENAVQKTTRVDISAESAQRLYEIIWWLGRVRMDPIEQPTTDEVVFSGEFITSTADGHGEFSVQPEGPRKVEVTLCAWPLSERYRETFDFDIYASFADFIMREALKGHGVDLEKPTAVLGANTYSSADDKFMQTTKPPPPNDPAAAKWIDRMLQILKNDRYAIWDLVSFEEPLRYPDQRIDEALFQILRTGLSPRALNGKAGEAAFGDAARAAEALARRKRPDAFPVTMQLLSAGNDDRRYAKNDLLEAATLLASTKPEYRQMLIEYLTMQLNELAKSPHFASVLFDSVWRGNFREMTPLMEKMAAASPDEVEDVHGPSWIEPPPPIVGRFHGARRVLIAWRESDVLTKLKLDSIIVASTAFSGGPAEFMRLEFAALSEDQRRTFREFVQWLDKYRPKEAETSWSTGSLATAFVGTN